MEIHISTHVIPQGFKCHRSNGVVFCFQGDRVFVSCMDEDCRRGFEANGESFVIASRVLDEISGQACVDRLSQHSPKGFVSCRKCHTGVNNMLYSTCSSQRSLDLLSDSQVNCWMLARSALDMDHTKHVQVCQDIRRVSWR